MPSYEHQQIVHTLRRLVERPQATKEHVDWIRAKPQVQLLKCNAQADEIILFASAPPTFIHTVIASEADVTPPNQDDLLEWSSGGPYTSRASYVYSNGPEGESVWFEHYTPRPTKLLQVQNIVFGRDRDGIDDDDPTYYELLQEFVHAAELHWRADQRAYCRIDENGDLEPVVSITKRSDTEPVTLVTCKREPLELFLTITDQMLVRFYDVTVLNHDRSFTSWKDGVKARVIETQLRAKITRAGSRPGLEHRRCDYYPSEPSPLSHCYKYPRRCRELTSQLSEPVRILPTRITGAGANPSATAS